MVTTVKKQNKKLSKTILPQPATLKNYRIKTRLRSGAGRLPLIGVEINDPRPNELVK